MRSLRGAAAAHTRPLLTTVRPLAAFYPAEGRHQKNQLKRHPPVLQALERSGIQVDSTAALPSRRKYGHITQKWLNFDGY